MVRFQNLTSDLLPLSKFRRTLFWVKYYLAWIYQNISLFWKCNFQKVIEKNGCPNFPLDARINSLSLSSLSLFFFFLWSVTVSGLKVCRVLCKDPFYVIMNVPLWVFLRKCPILENTCCKYILCPIGEIIITSYLPEVNRGTASWKRGNNYFVYSGMKYKSCASFTMLRPPP